MQTKTDINKQITKQITKQTGKQTNNEPQDMNGPLRAAPSGVCLAGMLNPTAAVRRSYF